MSPRFNELPRLRRSGRLAPLLLLALLAACGSSGPAAVQATVPASPAPSPSVAATAPPATTPPATLAPVQVPDFKLVAYQGDQVLGGHDGHFGAAFAAGKPVVLLYFGGL